MQNKSLAEDYFRRSKSRLAALDALFKEKSWADVVRESQEVVELALKGLLRTAQIEVPRVHDVSQILTDQTSLLPEKIRPHVDRLAQISRSLRRDRELAFYGSEDLTPSDFYKKADAETARNQARWVVSTLSDVFK